ncbi:MAG TPA: ABC transporter permease [Terriglobales bacterium]
MNLRFFTRKRIDEDLDEEIHSHLRMAANDHMERGLERGDAEAAARRELGNEGLIKEVTREMLRWTSLERLWQDVRFGGRILRKNPGTTLVSVITLALGISASTAIFSVVYGILLRPLPYDKPQQIVRVWEVDGRGELGQVTDPNFDDLRAQNHSLEGLAEFHSGVESVSGNGQPSRQRVASVSRDFFSVIGAHPVRGREFVPEEQHLNAAPAALVSYSYWQQYLNGASDLSGVRLVIENKVASVVGVLPPGFHFPDDTNVWMAREIDMWVPSRSAHNSNALGRLRDRVTVERAQRDLGVIAHRLKQQYGNDMDMQDAAVVPLREALTGDVRLGLLVLMGMVLCLLLIACANVMNLLLAQASAREGELALRTALGASRSRLVAQFLTEGLLLSLCGGAVGVIAAYYGVHALITIAPPNTPRLAEVAVNLPVLLFAFGLSVVVAAALGIFTALRSTSGNTQAMLAESSRSGGGRSRQRLGRAIIAGQLAMTLLLLVGAGLEGRSLLRVLAVDPGFRTEQIVTMDVALPEAAGPARARRVELLTNLLERVRTLPGVSQAAVTNSLPIGQGTSSNGGFIELNYQQLSAQDKDLIEKSAHWDVWQLDQATLKELIDFLQNIPHDPQHSGYAGYSVVSQDYFRTLGIPLLRGRFFDSSDTVDAPAAAIISESVARQKWPGQDPLGHTIEFGNIDGDLRLLTIVGVVGDVREENLEAPPEPIIYVNYRQRPQQGYEFSLLMRTGGDPASTLAAARRILGELDPTIPPRLNTFTEVFSASLHVRRFNLVLVGVFAASALMLAIAGIYGVLAYSVSRRTREIGVRIALGASAGNVRGLVLRQAMMTAAIGIGIGLVGALALTRTMKSLLFETSSMDPLTYLAVTLVLLLVAALAAYLPARRATLVDPIVALRHE